MENGLVFRSVPTRQVSRLIFVGDIHGCYDELVELLDRVAPGPDDLVVSVGDMVRKGPSPARCLDLWRARGYLAVRGNNEIKVLRRAHPILRFFAREDRDVLRRPDLLRWIASWPLVIDFPDAGLAVVHGGFLPHMRVSSEEVERHDDIVYRLRWIRRSNGEWRPVGKKERKKGDSLWAEQWDGDRFVVYGHTPVREPKMDRLALGLDTGCVYGGALTAAVHVGGRWDLVSVKARRQYAV